MLTDEAHGTHLYFGENLPVCGMAAGEMCIRDSTKGGYYVAVFNLGDKDSDISIPLADLEIYDGVNGTQLWSGEHVEEPKSLSVSLESHGARAYHFTYN